MLNVPITVDIGVKQAAEHNVVARLSNTSQSLQFRESILQLWGVPADPGHDELRGGRCAGTLLFIFGEFSGFESGEFSNCSSDAVERPFLTLPGACDGPASTNWETDSWENPGAFLSGSVLTPRQR